MSVGQIECHNILRALVLGICTQFLGYGISFENRKALQS